MGCSQTAEETPMTPQELTDYRRQRRRRALVTLLVSAGCVSALATADVQAADRSSIRPYAATSAWNTPIPANPAPYTGPGSVSAIVDNGLPLTADPDQYTLPVYLFDRNTPGHTVKVDGFYSTYDSGDNSRVRYGDTPTVSGIPIPPGAVPSEGSDSQIILWDPDAGIEYGFFALGGSASGGYTATNGYRYHTTSGYGGRFADGKAGRGAGTPYLAGLVRPWEIAQGHIDHALAFSYDSPTSQFVFPASKSDGGSGSADLPEGTRLQLDPSLTSANFAELGLSPTARVIAKALQEYGMYIIDVGGSSKIYVEDRKTAGWGADITRDVTRQIPLSAFRAIAPGQGCDGATPLTDQSAVAGTTAKRVVSAIRRVSARRLRIRKGPLLQVKLRSGSAVRIRVKRRGRGRHILLATGTGKATCDLVSVRLRPTAAGRRQLRGGRRISVELRLRAPGSTKSSTRRRSLRVPH